MLDSVELIDLPKIADCRGNLTFVESSRHVPFSIARVYYVYDVPGGVLRGGHAHKDDQEFIVAVSGSFRVRLNDGFNEKSYTLKRSYYGLYLPSMVWRDLDDFSSGSVCLVMSSNPYEEEDYYRDFDTYKSVMNHRRQAGL